MQIRALSEHPLIMCKTLTRIFFYVFILFIIWISLVEHELHGERIMSVLFMLHFNSKCFICKIYIILKKLNAWVPQYLLKDFTSGYCRILIIIQYPQWQKAFSLHLLLNIRDFLHSQHSGGWRFLNWLAWQEWGLDFRPTWIVRIWQCSFFF